MTTKPDSSQIVHRGDTVQEVLDSLQSQGAVSAAAIGVTPGSSISSTNVQAALIELATEKQDTLASGTTIKTINGQSILGPGNLAVAGGGGGASTAAGVSYNPTLTTLVATDVQGAITELDTKKQVKLVSGSTIKTINGVSLLGSGNFSQPIINVLDFGADPTGATASNTAFNNAALVAGFVFVPAGVYSITGPIATSATWWLAPNAVITGLTVANNGLMDLSRLTGKIVHYDNSPYRTARFGSPKDWLEKDYWRFSQSIAEVSAVASYSEIGLLGASRTSDNPAQTLGSIGVAAYSVNDSTSPKEPAWGMYVNYQKVPGSGPAYGMEIDNVNKGGTFNATPYNMGDGMTSDRAFNLWLTCGAGDGLNGAGNPVSAAIGIAANPTPFNRGVIFPSGCVNSAYNEVITSFNGAKFAWYDLSNGPEQLSAYISSAGPVAGLDFFARNESTGIVSLGMRLDGSNSSFRPINDDILDLGSPGNRWRAVYTIYGILSTSDERKKSDIKPIEQRVLDAWEQVEFYQFTLNGDNKTSFGVVAQRVVAAFAAEGLDAADYGVVEYKDDEYGVNYNQALVLEAALMRRKLEQLR